MWNHHVRIDVCFLFIWCIGGIFVSVDSLLVSAVELRFVFCQKRQQARRVCSHSFSQESPTVIEDNVDAVSEGRTIGVKMSLNTLSGRST